MARGGGRPRPEAPRPWVGLAGQGLGGGSGGVGGRGTGFRDGANFAVCILTFLTHTKRRFRGCLKGVLCAFLESLHNDMGGLRPPPTPPAGGAATPPRPPV